MWSTYVNWSNILAFVNRLEESWPISVSTQGPGPPRHNENILHESATNPPCTGHMHWKHTAKRSSCGLPFFISSRTPAEQVPTWLSLGIAYELNGISTKWNVLISSPGNIQIQASRSHLRRKREKLRRFFRCVKHKSCSRRCGSVAP